MKTQILLIILSDILSENAQILNIMDSTVLLTLVGFAITILIFITSQIIANSKFKRKQEATTLQFTIETKIKLASFERDLIVMQEKINMNRQEIIDTYQKYRDETIRHTTEFRNETRSALDENRMEHKSLKVFMENIKENLDFIRGKLSNKKEREENGG
ncbi:MAG: hypothetical protein WC222_11320 [Parachlamydiales bacterium]|jgi:hypothetical protein